MRKLITLIIVAWTACPFSALCAPQPLPRVVIALYEQDAEGGIRHTLVHSMAEMPLNHLGLTVEYHAINQPLPDLANRQDVRGIIAWFSPDARIEQPEAYLEWAEKAISSGKKFVHLGYPAVYPDDKNHPISLSKINRLFSLLGATHQGIWNEATYRATYHYLQPHMLLDAEPFARYRPLYELSTLSDAQAQVYLSVTDPVLGEAPLLMTNRNGGFAMPDYIYRAQERPNGERRQWLIDALAFFRDAFDVRDLPKPDATTLAGRRIYYSHIDGDGWNNVTQIEEYQEKKKLSSEIVMKDAIIPNPDLPVTLTLIAAEIDPAWAAVKESREIAERFLALPQVEAGTHTYSHPFEWNFFKDKNWKKEAPYLDRYRFGRWDKDNGRTSAGNAPDKDMPVYEKPDKQQSAKTNDELMQGYHIPRAYANKPYSAELEVQGSVDQITPLLPKGKRIELLTWPGNCAPYEEVIHLTRQARLQNINGGDSRFDNEYPTYAAVAPIGRQVGNERQIYASMSNENTYTDLWTRHFHAYGGLTQTLINTESPVRFKPLNIYYHIYAGERRASLNALLANIAYAKSQPIIPITTSEFTRIAEGFYSTKITPLRPDAWKVENRGRLQTIRFDQGSDKSVDFSASSGVIGQMHYQGSLYVYLDSAKKTPVISLITGSPFHDAPVAGAPYLLGSRWQVSNLRREGRMFRFTAEGFGSGEMHWRVAPGSYRIRTGKEVQNVKASQGELKFTLTSSAMEPIEVSIERVDHV